MFMILTAEFTELLQEEPKIMRSSEDRNSAKYSRMHSNLAEQC